MLRLPAAGDNAGMLSERPKTESPKRKRRWFRFSLRALLLVVSVAAICCPFGARVVRDWQARERQRDIDNAFRAFKQSPGSYSSPPGRFWLAQQAVSG